MEPGGEMEQVMTAAQERKEWLLKHMGKGAIERTTIVAAFRRDEDRCGLGEILGPCGWKVIWSGTCAEAIQAVQRSAAPIVISGRTFSDGEWRDIWSCLRARSHPPKFILASRLADESLWAEVLNLGGYELLLKPFRPEEVVRTVHGAHMAWQNAQAMDARHLEFSGAAPVNLAKS
jgi:DNA-binding response OmpR family regulator